MKPSALSAPVRDVLEIAGAYVCRACDRVTRSDWCPGCAAPLSPEAQSLTAEDDARVRRALTAFGLMPGPQRRPR